MHGQPEAAYVLPLAAITRAGFRRVVRSSIRMPAKGPLPLSACMSCVPIAPCLTWPCAQFRFPNIVRK